MLHREVEEKKGADIIIPPPTKIVEEEKVSTATFADPINWKNSA